MWARPGNRTRGLKLSIYYLPIAPLRQSDEHISLMSSLAVGYNNDCARIVGYPLRVQVVVTPIILTVHTKAHGHLFPTRNVKMGWNDLIQNYPDIAFYKFISRLELLRQLLRYMN